MFNVTSERLRRLLDIGAYMAEYGEWNRKGAVLSDKTAQKEYGVTRDLIVSGIQTGKLEYEKERYGATPTSEFFEASLNSI